MSISKRDELLEKALQAFYRNGFYAVGMDKLAADTGVSKTSMYKHFATKEELIEAVLRLHDEKSRNWLVRRIEDLAAEPLPTGRLLAIFDALDEWFHEEGFRSCMFIRASSEYPDPKHPVHRVSAEHKRLLLTHVIGLAHLAGADRPGRLAREMMLLKDGAIVTAHLQGAEGVAGDAKAAAAVLIAAATGGAKGLALR